MRIPQIRGPVAAATLTFLLLGIPAVAQTAAEERPETPDAPGLAELLRAAAETNPELMAARRRVLAAAEVPDRAASLPDPVLGTVIRNVDFPQLTLGEEMMSVIGVRFSQNLPTGGKRPARRALAEQAIEVAAARVETTRRRLNREIAQTWYRLGFVHRSLEIVEQTGQLLRDLAATAEARYRVGDGLQQDVLKAQVEISGLRNRIVMLQQQRQTLETRLNELAGRSAAAPVAAPEAFESTPSIPAVEQLYASATTESATILAQTRRVEQQQAAVDLARTGRSPDLMLSGAWMSRGGLPSIWEVNVGITLPIRKSERQDREIAEASEELAARRMETRSTVLEVEAMVREHLLELGRAQRLVELFRSTIIPQASLSLDSALSGYSVGKVDFLTVLDNVVKLLTFQLELERERSGAMVAIAGLEEQIGRSLGATPEAVWNDTDEELETPARERDDSPRTEASTEDAAGSGGVR